MQKNKAILLSCDDNYIKGLIALINSIVRNIPEAKIYLVHNLSSKNFHHIKDYIYKSEFFNESLWRHLPSQRKYVTKINQGKYQADFIEESHFFYVDSDVVVNRPFEWERPSTMTCDVKKQLMSPTGLTEKELEFEEKFLEKIELLRQFILREGGLVEREGDITLFFDGAFFANKDWLINVLRPEIRKCSIKYQKQGIPQHLYGMEYFDAAVCILQQPVKPWKLKQALPGLEFLRKFEPEYLPQESVEFCDLIHFTPDKPWNYRRGDYPFAGGDIWWDYYLNGPIDPI